MSAGAVMASLERFRCRVPFEVRFSDLDLNDHLNNGALVQYLAMARMTYCEGIGLGPLAELGFMLVSTTIDFRSEARFRAALTCGVRIERIGRSSVTFEQALWHADERVVAEARSIVVHTEDGTSGSPIPAAWQETIRAWEPLAPEGSGRGA